MGIRIKNQEDKKNTVLVGMKLDAESRELLKWTLVNVAKPGDLVLVVHVVPPPPSFGFCSTFVQVSDERAADWFQPLLTVHSELCHLNEITLELKICRGSSVRKSLVQQAISSNAVKLILGISTRRINSSLTGVAKYCEKNLPQDCSLVTMSNIISTRVDDGDSILKKAVAASACTVFTYKQLAQMTSNFSPDKIIGKGGSSSVYKGRSSDSKALAIKVLKPSAEALQEFASEVEIVSSLRNKNVVSLIGFCHENHNLMLVYEYLPKGTLEGILHAAREGKSDFSWAKRYKAAVGIAQGLSYLHGTGNSQPVIHRDVKSSNILFAEDFEPKLSDFGLALWKSALASYDTYTAVSGTIGYVAPEYFVSGKIDEKIDVYAFGVVLLELISGRKPISTGYPKSQESIILWANSIIQSGKVAKLLDPCLCTKYDADQFERMTLAASLCIRRDPNCRPKISLILKLLKGYADTLKWARSQSNTLEDQDSAETKASFPDDKFQSFMNLALLGVDDD